MTIVFLYRNKSSACSITERRAVKSFAETLSMKENGLLGAGGLNVRTKTSACFILFFFFCGPHMEGGEKIKTAGFVVNCSTITE